MNRLAVLALLISIGAVTNGWAAESAKAPARVLRFTFTVLLEELL